MRRLPPASTLFPYTTLFRSRVTKSVTNQPCRFSLGILAASAAMEMTALRRKPPKCPRKSDRSEEHTSELQSLRHLVCRLLLEKKKKQRKSRQYENLCTMSDS